MGTESNREIEEIASEWIARRDAGDWSDSDRSELDRWLNESDLHQIAFLRLERIWEEAMRLKVLGAGVQPGHVPAPGQWVLTPFFDPPAKAKSEKSADDKEASGSDDSPRSQTSSIGRPVSWAIAATVVLAVGTFLSNRFSAPDHRFATPIGGISSLPLADGSKIILNTASEVRVDLNQFERRVELEQGEAFFDVVKDAKRPFIVAAGDRRILVLGTKFSVRRDADDIRVVVTEGAVQVESQGLYKPERLTAGAVAHAGKTGTLVRQKPLNEVEEELSWRGGLLVFRDRTLADAITEFNRYTERKIVILDPRIAAMRVAGSFSSTNAEDFVHLLEQGYPLRVESRDEKILLLAR